MSEIPLTFTICRPAEIDRVKGKGITSTGGPNGCFIQYRGTTQEKERIKEAASALGLSYGTFMRCITNDVAEQVLALVAVDDTPST